MARERTKNLYPRVMKFEDRRVWILLASGSVKGPFTKAQIVAAWKAGKVPAGSELGPTGSGPWKPAEQCFGQARQVAADAPLPPIPYPDPATDAEPHAADVPASGNTGAMQSERTHENSWGGIVRIAIGVAILYFGGWRVVWGLQRWDASPHAQWADGERRELMLEKDCIAFKLGTRLDAVYYGIGWRSRFFDSAFLAWVAGSVGGTLVLGGLWTPRR